jgi:hypothetical protein
MKREVTAHVRRRGAGGTGAGQRPVVHHVNMRRSW